MARLSILHLVTFFLIFLVQDSIQNNLVSGAEEEFLPVAPIQPVEGDRRGDPIGVCKTCDCCAANNQNNCRKMPCCYRIDCNIPGKPFGSCHFVPKACNCNGCN